MNLELCTWKIVGTRPLMQDNPIGMIRTDDKVKVGSRKPVALTPLEECKKRLFLDDDRPYHPAIAFWKCLFVACPNRTLGKKAAAGVVAAAVAPIEEKFWLLDPKTMKALKPDAFMVDKRRAVNKKAGGIIVCRPMWKQWAGLLTLEIDRDFLPTLDGLTELMNIAGRFGVGVGRMRQVDGKSEWGGLGMGKFTAELKT